MKRSTFVTTERGSCRRVRAGSSMNAREARWFRHRDVRDSACTFEGDVRLPAARDQHPRRPARASRTACTTARTSRRTFSSSPAECLLLVEGEERRLRQWDFVHCPPWTEHVFVGAGEGPCVILMVGARDPTRSSSTRSASSRCDTAQAPRRRPAGSERGLRAVSQDDVRRAAVPTAISVKVAVLSDVHDNIWNLRAALESLAEAEALVYLRRSLLAVRDRPAGGRISGEADPRRLRQQRRRPLPHHAGTPRTIRT